jgi:hypothetical protein
MIGEFFVKLVKRAKEVVKALKEKCIALVEKLLPTDIVKKFPALTLLPETVNALNMGKRYRLTSDHSPVFSLYTFFADCQ